MQRLLLPALLGLAAATPLAAQHAGGSAPADDARLLARAERILERVPVIDGHNDLATEILYRAGGDLDRMDIARPPAGADDRPAAAARAATWARSSGPRRWSTTRCHRRLAARGVCGRST